EARRSERGIHSRASGGEVRGVLMRVPPTLRTNARDSLPSERWGGSGGADAGTPDIMKDRFGRQIDYLRISVIDHCNLRCVYCMPLRGLSFIPSPELLTAAEIERVAEAAVAVGFRKFRLTVGEPNMRPDMVEIVARVAALDGVDDGSMTTKAVLLPRI